MFFHILDGFVSIFLEPLYDYMTIYNLIIQLVQTHDDFLQCAVVRGGWKVLVFGQMSTWKIDNSF